jgi:hypothetical protein
VLRLPEEDPGPWELYRRHALRKVMFVCYLLRRQSSLLNQTTSTSRPTKWRVRGEAAKLGTEVHCADVLLVSW